MTICGCSPPPPLWEQPLDLRPDSGESMRIGIMLRHYEQQDGGVKVYTKRILPLLFSLERSTNIY